MRPSPGKFLIIVLALFITLSAFSHEAWTKTIFVNDAKGNNATCGAPLFVTPCKTIDAAMALLSSGDTIQIYPGFYSVLAPIMITIPNVTIAGSGFSTVIDGSHIPAAADTGILEITADNVTLKNFRIQGAASGAGGPCPNIDHPIGNAAILAGPGAIVMTSGLDIQHIEVTNSSWGIFLCSSNNAQIISSSIHDNLAAPGIGVEVAGSSDVDIEKNTFSTNVVDISLGVGAGSTNNTIRNNTFSGSTVAVDLDVPSNSNIIENNIFTIHAGDYGVTMFGDNSNNTIRNNILDGGDNPASVGIALIPFPITTIIPNLPTTVQNTRLEGNLLRHLNSGMLFSPSIGPPMNTVTTSTVVNNLIANNTTGIAFATTAPITNNKFISNVITQNVNGIKVTAAVTAGANNVFIQNNIETNTTAGWNFVGVVNNNGAFLTFNNWWGGPAP